jgi:hypothetical protein
MAKKLKAKIKKLEDYRFVSTAAIHDDDLDKYFPVLEVCEADNTVFIDLKNNCPTWFHLNEIADFKGEVIK